MQRAFCTFSLLSRPTLQARFGAASSTQGSASGGGEKKSSKALRKAEAQARRVEEVAAREIPTTSYATFGAVTPANELFERFGPQVLPPKEDSSMPSALSSETVRVAGRLMAMRDMGKILFLTIRSNGETLQVMASVGKEKGVASSFPDKESLKRLKASLRTGDVIGAEGTMMRTKAAGELTVSASSVVVVAPYVSTALPMCPDLGGHVPTVDPDLRYRYRFIDLMCNAQSRRIVAVRHKAISQLRRFLDQRGYTEVETPTFQQVPSGAAAKPFATHHDANDADLFLRVAPELYLKQCVVGGIERVYEIGKVFRNEDCSPRHNPEFTSCEFYQAYATHADLMPMTEALLREVAQAAVGTLQLQATSPRDGKTRHTIDLSKPFDVLPVIPTLEERIGVKFPSVIGDLDSPLGASFLSDLLDKHKVERPAAAAPGKLVSPAKLLDKLIDHFITDRIVQPTFVVDHPVFMSPLAKAYDPAAHPSKAGLSERFELFVNGVELCNAYSELTDPVEQKTRFVNQLRQRVEFADDEAQRLDEGFLKALQMGLPPTAGWGMGVDRLIMLLADATCIRDVILFPLIRQDDMAHDAKRKTKSAGFYPFDPHMTNFTLNNVESEFLRRGQTQQCAMLKTLRQQIDSVICRGGCDQPIPVAKGAAAGSGAAAGFQQQQFSTDSEWTRQYTETRAAPDGLSTTTTTTTQVLETGMGRNDIVDPLTGDTTTSGGELQPYSRILSFTSSTTWYGPVIENPNLELVQYQQRALTRPGGRLCLLSKVMDIICGKPPEWRPFL